MDFTLSVLDRFPEEQKVGVYRLGALANGTTAKPTGAEVTSGKVSSGSVTFKELNANQRYWAGAEVEKAWRFVSFTVGTPGLTTELSADDNATVTGKWTFSASPLAMEEAEINGALNHDGSKAGFYGVTPVEKAAKMTAINKGTVDGTYGEAEQKVIENLRTRSEEVEKALTKLGLAAE